MKSREPDVAIIGAGVAGLCAATRLAAAGRDVMVLEAADRIGGRLLRQHVAGVVVDGGGAWVGPRQPRILQLITELGLTTVPTFNRGRHLSWLGRRVHSARGAMPPVPALALADAAVAMARLDIMAKLLPRRAPLLDRLTVGSWLDRHVRTHGARTLIEIAVGATTGSSVDEVSLLAFATHVRAAGGLHQLTGVRGAGQDARVAGGAVGICERLADRLGRQQIQLSSVVRAVQPDRDHVVLRLRGDQAVRAEHVVVAVDPASCGRIDFGPLLSVGRQQLHRRFRMGSGIKYHIAYPTPFWRHAGLSGQTYADEGLARLTFDATSDSDGPGILVGFLGSFASDSLPAAELLDPSAVEERSAHVATDLARLFGPAATKPLAYIEQDWRAEAFLTGCVPAPGPGVLSAAGPEPHAPSGRVHWAGAETSPVWEGHMEGAVHSAHRVVAEIMSAP
ncbi:flavin monoamine oxidase family protein [Mycobacterium camsae]|uniref:flavin monoamine oxidase family protein n=1 Tax=Mycobacterium gordonae TaxID=1778 RepID=UPI0019802E40|nr:FAD-dependent oxidoreductase [Mycobacterium gordonae]